MCSCNLFNIKNVKQKIMPGRNRGSDESKRKEIRVLDLLLTTACSLRFREVIPLANSRPTR